MNKVMKRIVLVLALCGAMLAVPTTRADVGTYFNGMHWMGEDVFHLQSTGGSGWNLTTTHTADFGTHRIVTRTEWTISWNPETGEVTEFSCIGSTEIELPGDYNEN